jgi:hypothetical protein
MELAERRRQSSEAYQSPPIRTENRPYRMALSSVLPARSADLAAAGKVVFHVVGDTGGVSGRGAQENVAHHMTRQVHATAMPEQPSFLFHLGDVVYFHGEDTKYHDQFYGPSRTIRHRFSPSRATMMAWSGATLSTRSTHS